MIFNYSFKVLSLSVQSPPTVWNFSVGVRFGVRRNPSQLCIRGLANNLSLLAEQGITIQLGDGG